MGFDSAYEAITEETDDHRWAYGTGFTDPLSGVDTTVPAGIDTVELTTHCLALGDDALIMSHRLQEWLARAPELEEETALANIALDLLGQARLLYSRAGAAEARGHDEDHFAFARTEAEFGNVRLVELADADFGALIARLLVFSCWRLAVLTRLVDSADPVLSAIGEKGSKEVTYHRDYAARWAISLGDGTDYSRARFVAGLREVAPLTFELFVEGDDELREEVMAVLALVLAEAGVDWPAAAPLPGGPGRAGRHTAAMAPLLAELQSVAREHAGATW